jgi:hypothetical protein
MWADVLEAETDKDVIQIQIEGTPISADIARRSASIVANILLRGRVEALEGHALGDIQNWRNRDEDTVRMLRSMLTTATETSANLRSGFYAAHVVAATIMSALSS